MKNSNLSIVRHWIAQYKNLEVSNRWVYDKDTFSQEFEFLKDLKSETLEELKSYARNFIQEHLDELKSKKKIHFWTSPYGRTIETANIFLQEFSDVWIDIDKICIFEKIWEVKNFLWVIFDAIVNWKEVEIEWKKISFDKSITNPKNLNYSNYFFESAWLDIDQKYLKWLEVFNRINSIESYESITSKSKQVVDRLLNMTDNNKLVLIFSHQAFSDWLTLNQEQYKNWWQNPWEVYIVNQNTTYTRFKI